MQRGRYIQRVTLAGALAVAGWAVRAAVADLPPADPAVKVTATNLPAGWTAVPIGIYNTTDHSNDTIAQPQSVSVDSNGVWTVSASGHDLWNSDDGGLMVYQTHDGDGSVSFHLLARQTGGQDAAGSDAGWLRDAAAFRESLDSSARDALISATSGNGAEPAERQMAGNTPMHPGESGSAGVGWNGLGDSTHQAAGHDTANGLWVGIDRIGQSFKYYWSNDGKVWTNVARSSFPDLPDTMFAGVMASAHLDDVTDTTDGPAVSTIDNVQLGNQLLEPQSITNISYMPMDQAVVVSWNPVSMAAGDVTYTVYQVNPNDINNPKKLKSGIKESSFLATGLTNGAAYLFGVSATVNGVESGVQLPLPTGTDHLAILPSVVPNPPIPALPGFTLVNIGTASPGSVTLTSGTDLASAVIHMKASGYDISNESDGFLYLAMPVTGDVDVSVRFLNGPTEDPDGGGMELGGPMIRETLDADSRFVMAQVAAKQRMQFKRREIADQTPMNAGVDFPNNSNPPRPITMRVTRTGDTFQGYYSLDDGKTWKDLGDPTATGASSSIDTITGFSKTAWVGIALSGHSEGEFSEADIDQIVIKSPSATGGTAGGSTTGGAN